MPKISSNVVSRRRELFLASWQEHAPEATFAGFSLEQFEVESQKPLEVRRRMTQARAILAGVMLERDKTDEAYTRMLVAITNGVRADHQNFGPDSPLYRSLGFVPRSERKRPRLRKKESPTAEPAEDAGAV
jgi:hypothetical protein